MCSVINVLTGYSCDIFNSTKILLEPFTITLIDIIVSWNYFTGIRQMASSVHMVSAVYSIIVYERSTLLHHYLVSCIIDNRNHRRVKISSLNKTTNVNVWISTHTLTHNCCMALWILSRATRMSRYRRNIHIYRGHQSSTICFLPFIMIRAVRKSRIHDRRDFHDFCCVP